MPVAPRTHRPHRRLWIIARDGCACRWLGLPVGGPGTAKNLRDQDYYIESVDTGARSHPWRWELKRRSSPMGVKLGASGYQSEAAALYPGQRALAEFLKDLSERNGANELGQTGKR